MHSFFDAWDRLEAAHPFGVMYFRQLFTEFGISEGLAGHVDELNQSGTNRKELDCDQPETDQIQ